MCNQYSKLQFGALFKKFWGYLPTVIAWKTDDANEELSFDIAIEALFEPQRC